MTCSFIFSKWVEGHRYLRRYMSALTCLPLLAISLPSPRHRRLFLPSLVLVELWALVSFSSTCSELWSLFLFSSLPIYAPPQFSYLLHLPRVGTASYEMRERIHTNKTFLGRHIKPPDNFPLWISLPVSVVTFQGTNNVNPLTPCLAHPPALSITK